MKRLFDLVLSATALLALLPLLALLWLLVRAKLGKPAIFAQKRPGRHGTIFTLYKFRSMTDTRDADGTLLPDAQRLTRFGRFLRASSLDELPELWNILRGDMSFVGPRPLLVEYLQHYSPEQARRHDVRPGLTGWAQINGRNNQSWDQRFSLDVWYVDNRSFLLDLKIIFLTAKKVLIREGINEGSDTTKTAFTGNATSQPDGSTRVESDAHRQRNTSAR